MKASINCTILFSLSLILSITSCNKSDNLSEWKYNFIVKDVISEQPLEGVELRLLQHYGGSALLHDVTATTNSNGEVDMISLIDEDSLTASLNRDMLDPSVVWQELFVTSPFYQLQQIEQNSEIFQFVRKHFEQEIEITVYVWKAAQVNLTFSDINNTQLYDYVSLDIRASHADKEFKLDIGNPGGQSPDWLLKIPAEKEVTFEWDIFEGPDFATTELVETKNDKFNLKFQEVVAYTIEH